MRLATDIRPVTELYHLHLDAIGTAIRKFDETDPYNEGGPALGLLCNKVVSTYREARRFLRSVEEAERVRVDPRRIRYIVAGIVSDFDDRAKVAEYIGRLEDMAAGIRKYIPNPEGLPA